MDIFERVTERDRFSIHFPRWLQCPVLGQVQARSQEHDLGLCMDVGTIFCYFSQVIIRELDHKCSSWDLNLHME